MMNMNTIATNNKGHILVATIVTVLIVTSIAYVAIHMTRQDLSSSTNTSERIKAFYAADGLITMMVQDIIDGHYEKYLYYRNLDSTTSVGVSNNSRYIHSSPFRDTLKGSGSGINNSSNSDNFYFAYTKLTGDIDMKVKLVSMSNPSENSRAGLMIRNTKSNNSCYAMTCATPTSSPWKFQLLYRSSPNGSSAASPSFSGSFPRWLRLQRTGNTITSSQSPDGKTWYVISTVNVTSIDKSVYAGLASSGAGNICTAVFDSLTLGNGKGSDSYGNITLDYTMNKVFDGFDLTATTSMKGDNGDIKHTSTLKQHFSLNKNEQVPDSGYLHYVIYDYKADGTNPNFQNCEAEENHFNLVDSFLSNDRKPIFKRDYATAREDRNCFRWYDNCSAPMKRLDQDPSVWERACCVDRINEWFRVSGGRIGLKDTCDTSYAFLQDPIQKSKWRWKKKSDGSDLIYDANAKAYKGSNFNYNDPMVNYIGYDSLKLTYSTDKSGDFPSGKCQLKPKMYSIAEISYVPFLKNQGFINDKAHRTPENDDDFCVSRASCENLGHLHPMNPDTNFCWAVEIHQPFIYHEGKDHWFWYEGQDDIWVFVNGKFASTINSISIGYLWLDSLRVSHNLKDGEMYMLDFFQVNRMFDTWEIQIYSDMDFFSTTKPQSNWRRDYGKLD